MTLPHQQRFLPYKNSIWGSSLGDLCRLNGGYAHSGSALPTAVLVPPSASSGPAHSGLVIPAKLPSQLLGTGQTARWRCPLCPDETLMTLFAWSLLILSL